MRSTMDQVSFDAQPTAASGLTCSVLTSPGVHRAADAEHAEAMHVAEIVLDLA